MYIRYQNKTYIYLLNQKRPELAQPAPRFLYNFAHWATRKKIAEWLIVPHQAGWWYNERGVQWAILKFFCDHISYMFKTVLQYLCKCIVCPKVYIKIFCLVFPITPSWKNYQSSRKKSGPLNPTLPYLDLYFAYLRENSRGKLICIANKNQSSCTEHQRYESLCFGTLGGFIDYTQPYGIPQWSTTVSIKCTLHFIPIVSTINWPTQIPYLKWDSM